MSVFAKPALGLAVVLAFFVVVELALGVVGVVPVRDRSDPYVGFAGYAPLFVPATSANGVPVYRTAAAKANWFNPQEFTRKKAAGATRVFCLGGSTTYGRPYEDPTSFCGWLRALLPVADPSRQWEVVNAGGISYASYRIVRLMEELVDYEPDLFIVYTGHNEFLERRTYGRLLDTPELLRDLGSLASGLRLYAVLSDAIYPERDMLDEELDVVLDQSVGPDDYRRDDVMQDAVLTHLGVSLRTIERLGREAGGRVLFVTPASNVRDFSPFKSQSSVDLVPDERARIETLKAAIDERANAGDHAQALARADEGLAVDGRDADLWFARGRALLELADVGAAREALLTARDEDIAPLRALSPVARLVVEVAEESSAGLVDFATILQRASPDGIPGDEHFLDHVHPTIAAHRLLALAIIDEVVEMGVATRAASWNESAVAEVTRGVEGGLDEAAHARALANVARVLSWAGKQDEARGVAERATSLARDPHTLFQMVTVLMADGRLDEAAPYAAEAARLLPNAADVRKMNGIILAETGRNAEAIRELEAASELGPGTADTHYHLAVALAADGHTDRALAAYRRSIDLEPRNADALNNVGTLLAQRGDYRGALEWFERAVEVDPSHPHAPRNLARAKSLLEGG